MKQRILSLVLALVLTSAIGAFPAAAEEETGGTDDFVVVTPNRGAVTRAEIEAKIVKKILSEPVVPILWQGTQQGIQVGPLCITPEMRATLAAWVDLKTPDDADTTSLTFPPELARFSICIGTPSGAGVACGGKNTRRVPVKQMEGVKTPVVLFANGVPVVVIGGTGKEANVSYGSGTLTPVEMDTIVMIGNANLSASYSSAMLEEARKRSRTTLVTAKLTARAATAEEKGAFSQAYAVTLSLTDGAGNELGTAWKTQEMVNGLSVRLPFLATLVRRPAGTLPRVQFTSGETEKTAAALTTSGTYVFGVWDIPFQDIYEANWYFPAVFDAVEQGWMTGCDYGYFYPWREVSRAELVTMLWRAAGKPQSNTKLSSYADTVPAYAARAFRWALEQKILTPAENYLNPNGMVTREMLAVLLTNYLTAQGEGSVGDVAGSLDYPDLDEISPWAMESVRFVVSRGLMDVIYDGTFAPREFIERWELAMLLSML